MQEHEFEALCCCVGRFGLRFFCACVRQDSDNDASGANDNVIITAAEGAYRTPGLNYGSDTQLPAYAGPQLVTKSKKKHKCSAGLSGTVSESGSGPRRFKWA